MLILYGSESGTAQDLAEEVWRQCHRSFPNAPISCLSFDDYQIEELCHETLAVFVVATSGQGEMPTNMRNNWRRLLSRNLAANWLLNLKFAVLALGDSSYQKYNFAGKKLHRRLIQLGAVPLLDISLADEQHKLGVDEVFEKWLPELVSLVGGLGDTVSLGQNKRVRPLPMFLLEFAPTNLPESAKFYQLRIVNNERLTDQSHFQDTRLITLDVGSHASSFAYSPGDVLMVLPENLPNSVQTALNSLASCSRFMDQTFHICRTDKHIPIRPQFMRFFATPPPTLLDCFRFFFDLQSIPKRSFIRHLSNCSSDEMEAERLSELCSEEGIEDYMDYCYHPKRSIAELLRDFPKTSALLTPRDLFEFFPVIRPRAFSIASSPQAHVGKIQILVARVKYSVKKMATQRLGLCSNFLCDRSAGDKVFVRIRSGLFKYGADEPLLLIGPGTGVAPHRSIVAENEFSSTDRQILLFFGCRGKQRDFYFEDEWPTYAKTKLIAAFSRDQREKHKILANAAKVWELLSNQAAKVFIAGSAGEMPRSVISALKEVVRISSPNFTDQQEADEYIDRLERIGRIHFETWS